MKKFLLVYNPVSGNAAFRKKLDGVIESLQRRNILPTLYRTRQNDSPEEFAECVKISGAEGIISAGGDGTLHEVVNRIKKFQIDLPIGIIGSGTSNDFATHLGISDTEKYFDAMAEGKIRRVDLGLANGKEYFINVASAGVFTGIAHEVNARQKNSLGKLAYYLHGVNEIPKFKSVHFEILADGKKFETDAFLFLVLNSSAVAGMKKITDAAKIDDGKLDLIALKKSGPGKLLSFTKKLFSGKCIQSEPEIFYLQAKNFEIKSSERLTSDLDGEEGDDLPLKIETVPNAINFFVP